VLRSISVCWQHLARGSRCRAERLCSVTLTESAQITVTLHNPGEGAAGYRLLTN
jgi:hypothetical protein